MRSSRISLRQHQRRRRLAYWLPLALVFLVFLLFQVGAAGKGNRTGPPSASVMHIAEVMALCVFGAILIVVAWIVWNLVALRRTRRVVGEASYEVCPQCGYSLGGVVDLTSCPECGAAVDLDECRAKWTKGL